MHLDLMRLKAERVAKSLTQKQLASKVGMSREAYAKRESGFVNIGANELIKIITALGYSKKDIPIFFSSNVLKKERKRNKKGVANCERIIK